MELTTPTIRVDYKRFGLNSRQARFARGVLNSNKKNFEVYQEVYGTKSVASATAAAARLLAQDKVQKYMDAIESKAVVHAIEENKVTVERVLQEETRLAFLDIGALVDEDGFFIQNIKDLPEDVRRAVVSLEITEKIDPYDQHRKPYYKLKFADKGRSLERLEKYLGMLREKVEVGVDMTLQGLLAIIDGKKTGQPMIPHLKD